MECDVKKSIYAVLFLPIFASASPERQVVFVHTDILGSPIARSSFGAASSKPDKPNIADIKLVNGDVNISWSAVPGANYYKIELLKGKNCGEIIVTKTSVNQSIEFDLPSSGDYAARVSACNAQCSLPKATTWVNFFSFEPPFTIGGSSGSCTF